MNTDRHVRSFRFALAAITLLALALNGFQLARQPVSYDDYYVALSAINYTESGQLGPTMWNHPALRNILVYYALRAFGTGVLGVKGVSLLLGTLCTPLVGLVSRRIFKDDRIALIAAFLWACDALVIDFSRQGINDIYLAFFPLAGIYLVYRFRDAGKQAWLLGAGICFGLGLASKWSVMFPLLSTIVLLVCVIGRAAGSSPQERTARYCHTAVMLVVVPLLVYLLTFLPWFGRGYSLAEWPALQRSMFLETSQHAGYKPKLWLDRDNRAWKWFVVPSVFVDPFMNLDSPDGDSRKLSSFETSATVVLGVANPLVWLLVLPAMYPLLLRGIRERDEGALYLLSLFLISYLPLVLSPRPIWLNTALSVLPYAIMAVAWFVWMVVSRFKRRQLALSVYLLLVLLVASPLYLLAIGKGMRMPLAKEYLMKNYLEPIKQNMPAAPVTKAPKHEIAAPPDQTK